MYAHRFEQFVDSGLEPWFLLDYEDNCTIYARPDGCMLTLSTAHLSDDPNLPIPIADPALLNSWVVARYTSEADIDSGAPSTVTVDGVPGMTFAGRYKYPLSEHPDAPCPVDVAVCVLSVVPHLYIADIRFCAEEADTIVPALDGHELFAEFVEERKRTSVPTDPAATVLKYMDQLIRDLRWTAHMELAIQDHLEEGTQPFLSALLPAADADALPE